MAPTVDEAYPSERIHDDAAQQPPPLDEAQRHAILACHQKLVGEGQLPTTTELDSEFRIFRERFGPEVLKNVDGEALLNLMHDHANHDSLVYWLEYKNDDVFKTTRHGGIAGGSALKFGIFRQASTGNWRAGDASNKPMDISVEEAIEIARVHRDELLKGIAILDQVSHNAPDEAYAWLQKQMDARAPTVSDLAWGHKYFYLLFPNKLDDFHSTAWQRFRLLKLLQMPPAGEGRFLCAGRFVRAANQLGLSMNHFSSTLDAIQGGLRRYWRIGTHHNGNGTFYWPLMRDRGRIAIGWEKLGDISWIEATKESRERLKHELGKARQNTPQVIGKDCTQLTNFVAVMGEGDIVLAANGMRVLGVGRVIGGYEYHPEDGFPHQRQVEWLTLDEWSMPFPREGLQSTVRELKRHDENILAIEHRLQSIISLPPKLLGVATRIQSILERKGQVILFGPPGTGKTFWAERAANDLAAMSAFGKLFDSLDATEKQVVQGVGETPGLVRLCCFHPGYGYEDFLEGYRPRALNGQVAFELRDGVFKRLCDDARKMPDRNFYLIVDEINRGDIPRIFGELLTVLEKSKRGKQVILPLSQKTFCVPTNVFLLGTMNTADHSISLLDVALRRRFGFIELMPDAVVLKDSIVAGIALQPWLEALNASIRKHAGRDARNLQIGHSYLMHSGRPLKDLPSLRRAVRDDIIPLLQEYCYDDYGALKNILGGQIINAKDACINPEIFDRGHEASFVAALLAPFPGIATSPEAIEADESPVESESDEERDDDAEGET